MESAQLKLPPNPCEKANFLSKLFFVWTLPFFKKGYKQVLKIDDMYEPLTCDRSELLGNRLEANWNKRELKPKRASLLSVLFSTFWKEYIFLGVLYFINEIVIRLGQPFLLGMLLQYFKNREDTEIEYDDALIYAGGIVVLNGLNALLSNQINQIAFHNGMKARVAVTSLIYRKSLRLSQTALGGTSSGKLVNLLSNDVNRFDWASVFVNSLWASPILTIIVGCLIWIEVRIAGLIGLCVVLSVVPFLSYSGKLTSKYRHQTALRTDERVRFMEEIISAVQVIKMYAWEKPFAKLIAFSRKMELKVVRKSSYIRALYMTAMLFTNRIALFCTMLAIASLYGPEQITAARIFAISTYFNITSFMLTTRFPRGISDMAEVLVALKRIQQFLELDEKKPQTETKHEDGKNANGSLSVFDITQQFDLETTATFDNPSACISLRNVRARWTMPSDDSVGSSKAKTKKNQATIQNGISIKDLDLALTLNDLNIEFPKGKLIGVIGAVGAGKSSLLQVLLRELPIESGSISINGSISYASQEPWMFAASVRQNILFGQEYDRDRYNSVVKTCALKKDFEQFENGDLTIVGERGASLSGGQRARINLARACYRNADIYLFDDPLSAVDAHVGTHIFDKCLGPKGQLAKRKSTRILVTHQVHFLKEADWLVILKDGIVEMQGKPIDLYKNDDDFAEFVGMTEPDVKENLEPFSRRISESSSTRSVSSTSLNSWKNQEANGNIEKDQGVQLEASSKGQVQGSIIANYFKAGAHWMVIVVLLFSFLFVQFLASATDYWVSVWTKQEESRPSQPQENSSFFMSTEFCIYVEAALLAGLLIFGIARSIGLSAICIRISQNIHNTMFKGIISTSMRFFDINPSGRILNRFSKDLGIVDENLPKSLLDAIQNILTIFGAVVVAAVVNPYFLIPVFVLTILFTFVRKVYLKTSKDVKRLDGIVKSPAFTHLAATLKGLSTVRAYNSESILRREFDNLQDTHTACWYMSVSTTSMFGFSLDFICTLFIASMLSYYMLLETGASGDKIGLAISQAIGLSGLVQWGVRQSAEVVNQMTSVERMLEYRDLESEKQPKKPLVIAANWPLKGSIEFRNVFYRYFAEGEPVLRDLLFMIKPMEKIGIVGRTGAGKSSLIGAIFRLGCIEGEILIDGIDTANVQLSDLRKRIAIIPQDPVLFSGTLRRNLDPFEEYSDADIWNALESVELKNVVSEAFGLQSPVLPQGQNFSVGQRQLLCLARAILRRNRILVLDEATANVDPQTDLLIQQTIRDKFAECTVLTVAHRLHTIIDSDRVIVMDAGKAADFDEPHNLLQNENGIFFGMVKALGDQEFDRLSQIALEKFNSNSNGKTTAL